MSDEEKVSFSNDVFQNVGCLPQGKMNVISGNKFSVKVSDLQQSVYKRHLDWFSHFCRAHYCHRPTDHTTRSVTTDCIYVHCMGNAV